MLDRGKSLSVAVLAVLVVLSSTIGTSHPTNKPIVGEAIISSGGLAFRLQTASLEVASLLRLIKHLGNRECFVGGYVVAEETVQYGFYFDPERIMIFNPKIPELSTVAVIFTEPLMETTTTISNISMALDQLAGKVCYIPLDEIVQYNETVKVQRDAWWLQPVRVTVKNGSDASPSLIRDSNGTYRIAYTHEANVYVVSSLDGMRWSEPVPVIASELEEWAPSLLQSENGVFMIVYKYHDFIQITHSSDGIVWSQPLNVVEGHWPFLYQDSKGAYWMVYMDVDSNIAVIKSHNAITWFEPMKVVAGTEGHFTGWNPQVLEDSEEVYWLACASFDPTFGVYLLSSNDGKTWSRPIKVVDGTDEFSFIQDSNGTYWIAFHSRVSSPDFPSSLDDGNSNIFVINSTDCESWSKPVRVTDDPANDFEPSLMQDSNGALLIAFTSWRDGDYNVYVTGRAIGLPFLSESERAVASIEAEGYNVTLAQRTLAQAQRAFEEGNVTLAEELARRALTLAQLSKNATITMRNAEIAIEDAEKEGRTSGLDDARNILQEAADAYERGDYEETITLAKQAKRAAEEATAPSNVFYLYGLAFGGAAGIFILVTVIFYRKRKRRVLTLGPSARQKIG